MKKVMKILLINHFLLLFSLAFIAGCKDVGTAKFDEVAAGTGGAQITDPSIIFAGVTSIINKTDSSVTITWLAHADAVSYEVYNTASGSPVLVSLVLGQASNTVILTGLTSGATYKYRVRMKTLAGASDTNTNDVSVTMDAVPTAPSSLALITPAGTPDFADVATIRVSGVKSGDTVKLYTDACTTEVASGVAAGTTIDLTTSSLAVGAYTFQANSRNTGISPCSTATASYTRSACAAGYVLSGGVCVMSFAGVASVDQKTDSTLRLNWTAHAMRLPTISTIRRQALSSGS